MNPGDDGFRLPHAVSIADARRVLAQAFRQAGLDSPELDARLLVGRALARDHAKLAATASDILGAHAIETIAALAKRRLGGEPIARILGEKEFWGLPFSLSADALIPRPETETLVESALKVLEQMPATARIADLGTGSGALLLSLLSEKSEAFGVGTDRSMNALKTARANAAHLNLVNRAAFVLCDFGAALKKNFDCVVSNPPYVATQDIASLAIEVRTHDPHLALDGGPDGLHAYRAIASQAPRILRDGGALIVELGAGQEAAVTAIMTAQGLIPDAPARLDIAGIPRALTLWQA